MTAPPPASQDQRRDLRGKARQSEILAVSVRQAALDDWERYLHDERPQLPLLIRCALLHYQFETIRPFLDGNGRIGRLFIVLYLMDQGRLPAPLLATAAPLAVGRSALSSDCCPVTRSSSASVGTPRVCAPAPARP